MTSEEKAREFIATLLMTDDARFDQKVAELAAMLPADAEAPAPKRKRVAKLITKLKIARGPRLPIKKKK